METGKARTGRVDAREPRRSLRTGVARTPQVPHLRFEIDAQPVGDAVDVVVVRWPQARPTAPNAREPRPHWRQRRVGSRKAQDGHTRSGPRTRPSPRLHRRARLVPRRAATGRCGRSMGFGQPEFMRGCRDRTRVQRTERQRPLAARRPKLALRSSGSRRLRRAHRRSIGLKFHEPPRATRDERRASNHESVQSKELPLASAMP